MPQWAQGSPGVHGVQAEVAAVSANDRRQPRRTDCGRSRPSGETQCEGALRRSSPGPSACLARPDERQRSRRPRDGRAEWPSGPPLGPADGACSLASLADGPRPRPYRDTRPFGFVPRSSGSLRACCRLSSRPPPRLLPFRTCPRRRRRLRSNKGQSAAAGRAVVRAGPRTLCWWPDIRSGPVRDRACGSGCLAPRLAQLPLSTRRHAVSVPQVVMRGHIPFLPDDFWCAPRPVAGAGKPRRVGRECAAITRDSAGDLRTLGSQGPLVGSGAAPLKADTGTHLSSCGV